ncbi:hypothetical protein FGO68_gene9410 [Halteria grandinella]|uniref:Uncharacterized protein n=1 Tax=Halteria grandinella TaxID=5974 RepID=A0A8J8SXB1_HALGN|nr:hypothetical protein FGO68_gene9410 [Halteria grandinella]
MHLLLLPLLTRHELTHHPTVLATVLLRYSKPPPDFLPLQLLYRTEIVLHEWIHMGNTLLLLYVLVSNVFTLFLALFLLFELEFAAHLLHGVTDYTVLDQAVFVVFAHQKEQYYAIS